MLMQQYQDKVREMPFLPKCSFKRDCFGARGNVNKMFRSVNTLPVAVPERRGASSQ
jgi:hypothetical protein